MRKGKKRFSFFKDNAIIAAGQNLQAEFIGRIQASQAWEGGSIPITCSFFLLRKTSKINGFPYFVSSIPTVRSVRFVPAYNASALSMASACSSLDLRSKL